MMMQVFGEQGEFAIARRGYDRRQVDEYLAGLKAGGRPANPPAFTMVRRGYKVEHVDRRLAELGHPRGRSESDRDGSRVRPNPAGCQAAGPRGREFGRLRIRRSGSGFPG
jgi:hypothetical protein